MGEIWWQQISNANKLITEIADAAKQGTSVLLYLPDRLPYPFTFKNTVKERLSYIFADRDLNEIDLNETDVPDVPAYFLRKYCKEAIRYKYRGTQSVGEFLATQSGVTLHRRYFWVHNIGEEQLKNWVDFINDYARHIPSDRPKPYFILEVQDDKQLKLAKGAVTGLSFNDIISDYDKYAFCTIIATDNSIKSQVRDYLGQLVACMVKDDVELCGACIKSYKEFLENPVSTLTSIVSNTMRSDDRMFEINTDIDAINETIWTAQIRTIFPLVEKARIRFIKQHHQELSEIIATREIILDNKIVDDPYQLELGTLIYICGMHYLIIPQAEYNSLNMYRNARNDMAHMRVMEYSQVQKILEAEIN